jgi:iron complex transport system substrate-binding protein
MALKIKVATACIALLVVASMAPVVSAHGGGGGNGEGDPHVEFVRNVEEVKGHLEASLTLARNGDEEGASLHANHPPDDYISVIVPRVEEEDPELASEIESTLNEAPEMAEGDTDEYADYIQNDVHPLLDDAVETVVPEEELGETTFESEVNIVLLNRIDDEYSAAVAENGTTVLEGEYWDGRGFLSRIEERHSEISSGFEDEVNSDMQNALEELRTKYENRVPPSELTPTTARLRVLYEAGAETDHATVDDEVEAVDFMRNAEEVKGHLESSIRLKRQDDSDGSSLHAGHPTDYVGALGPATYHASPETWESTSEVMYTVGDRVHEDTAEEYESYVRDEVFPAIDSSVDTAVPSEYRTTDTRAHVAAELTGRLMEEYSAAVTEDGTVELEGEYWDGRGFLIRITEIHEEELSGEMSDETNSALTSTLEELRSAYENEVPPSELRPTTVRLRVLFEAGAETDDAVIDDEEEAVQFMRNAEEVKGHLESSVTLKGQDDSDGASLHAGHPTDYLMALGPATYAADATTYESLSEVSYATGDRVADDSPEEYESYVRDEVFPVIDSSVEEAVPDQYRTTETRAQVAVGLAGRLMEEYEAAVTEDGTVELEGEYWDGRGFLVRITEIHEEELSGEMDDETNEELTTALEELRSAYEEEVPPSELEPPVNEVESVLTSASFDGSSESGEESSGEAEGGEDSMSDGGSDAASDGETSDSGSEDGQEEQDGEEEQGGGQGMPGFTALAALVALVIGVAVVALRR